MLGKLQFMILMHMRIMQYNITSFNFLIHKTRHSKTILTLNLFGIKLFSYLSLEQSHQQQITIDWGKTSRKSKETLNLSMQVITTWYKQFKCGQILSKHNHKSKWQSQHSITSSSRQTHSSNRHQVKNIQGQIFTLKEMILHLEKLI